MQKSYQIIYIILILCTLVSCVSHKKIVRNATNKFLSANILKQSHTGIALWDNQKNTFIVRHQSERYFVPASNVKIATLYAALQYLPDSLPTFDYYHTPDTLFILPKGDPSLLDTAFQNQPALDFLKKEKKNLLSFYL